MSDPHMMCTADGDDGGAAAAAAAEEEKKAAAKEIGTQQEKSVVPSLSPKVADATKKALASATTFNINIIITETVTKSRSCNASFARINALDIVPAAARPKRQALAEHCWPQHESRPRY